MYELSMDGLSLVSCVMVTTGRVDLISKSLRSFLLQKFPSKELIVVSQGSKEQNEIIKNLTAPHHNIQFVEAPKRLSLGEMRNLSVELALGEVICQWDDDDIYHPNRISTQFKALRYNTVASLYSSYLKYFVNKRTLYMIDHLRGSDDYVVEMNKNPYKKYLCGSIMFRKSCFHEVNNRLYPECGSQSQKEEDLNVLQRLMRMGEVSAVSCGYEYCYVFHGQNVYDSRHHEMLLHKKHIATMQELTACKTQIEDVLQIGGVQENVCVCTAPILDLHVQNLAVASQPVFTYNPL